LSSEYGWSSKEILQLTLKEVGWRLRNINKRRKSEVSLQAALHGREMKGSSKENVIENSPEMKEKIDAAKKAFVNRQQKKIG